MDEVPDGFGGVFREEFEVQGAMVCGDSRVASSFDAASFQHVFLVAEEGEVAGCVGGEAGGGEGGGGAASRMLRCVERGGFGGVTRQSGELGDTVFG